MSKTLEQRISSKEEQIKQLKNQRKQLVLKHKAAERKERNHRLYKRHGHLEMYMPDLALITHEQFDEFVRRAIDTSYGQGILAEIVARTGSTATTKQTQLSLTDGADKDTKPPKAGSSGAQAPSVPFRELSEKEKELREGLTAAREKKKSLSTVAHNARMLLGYQELETQDRNPVVTPSDPRLIPACKLSYADSEKAGELESYFLNCRLNKDCAEAIRQAIMNNRKEMNTADNSASYDMIAAAHEVIEMYGRERAEWVVAAIIEGDASGILSEHKKWASQKKLPDEPIDIRPLVGDSILNGFIKRFVEVAQQKSAKINQDNKPSMTDILASAAKRSKEQSRFVDSPRKPGRSYGPDL